MGALTGIKILGFTHFAQAPFALQLLGDFGADIVNIERPGAGDFNRNQYRDPSVNNEGLYFLAMNRNKRSVALNLKSPEAKDIIYKLMREADAVVSNFRPGVLDKLGFGFEDAKKQNPAIVYAEAAGYGSSGPYEKLPGQDLMGQAMSGYASIVGNDGPPQTGGTFVADMYSSMLLASSICAALVNKERGGKAQKIEVNLLNSAIHLQSQELTYFLNTGRKPTRPKNYSSQAHSWAPYGIYPVKDGYICLSTVAVERVKEFGELLGIEGLEKMMPDEDVMFRDREKLFEVISAKTRLENRDDIIKKLRDNGFWCGPVYDYEEVEKDPQVAHNQIIRTIEHPVAGKVRVVGPPVYMSETPPDIRLPPPLLGQHNEEVLAELGYSSEEIAALKEKGVL
ncbi:CoA transferase [Ruminococcaceae bacterium OttesenSCG-928-D13]|nr:CoA transferase [Ruminococcaceae bacterium OttesenSCG-928-D13]